MPACPPLAMIQLLPSASVTIRVQVTAVAVVGLGPAIARRLLPDCAPVDLRSFDQLGAKTGFHAPSTQHDLWICFQGAAPDALFDRALAAHRTFGAYAELALEDLVTLRG